MSDLQPQGGGTKLGKGAAIRVMDASAIGSTYVRPASSTTVNADAVLLSRYTAYCVVEKPISSLST